MVNRVEKYFDDIAEKYDDYKRGQRFYYQNLKKLLSTLIPAHSDVFEVGCGTGDLIASLNPVRGRGFDISQKMIDLAQRKHKNILFSKKWPKEKFDYIFMCDVIEHLNNPGVMFRKISKLMTGNSTFICTMANPKLEKLLMLAEKLKLKMPEGPHFRPEYTDINELLKKSGLKIQKHNFFLLIPVYIPIITPLMNKHLEKYLKKYAFIEYFTATKL